MRLSMQLRSANQARASQGGQGVPKRRPGRQRRARAAAWAARACQGRGQGGRARAAARACQGGKGAPRRRPGRPGRARASALGLRSCIFRPGCLSFWPGAPPWACPLHCLSAKPRGLPRDGPGRGGATTKGQEGQGAPRQRSGRARAAGACQGGGQGGQGVPGHLPWDLVVAYSVAY